MACKCGHNKDVHESGRDYGYHGYKCAHRNERGAHDCGCEFYDKKVSYYPVEGKSYYLKDSKN